MAAKYCLKISFKGLTRYIMCDAISTKYEDILQIVMEEFCISFEYQAAIQLYNEQGHILNKESLEYLLLLFPQPQGIIFIRLDATKINATPHPAQRMPFGISKLNNTLKTSQPVNVEAVPVRRQNCFIGQLPAIGSDVVSSLDERQERHCAREIMKRMNLIQDHAKKRKNIAAGTSVVKRALRI